MKKVNEALVQAASDGTVNRKALAIKIAAMVGATAAGIVGTVLVQRAIEANSEETTDK